MRITESALRQLIRETLLTEAAMTPEMAKERGIQFDIMKYPDSAVIYARIEGRDSAVGTLSASPTGDPCSDAWEIGFSLARIDGLGPLMYDLMIDVISPHPLMSDRIEVSKDAKRVWDYYRDRRGDIEQVQLDDEINTLTPETDDNCYQKSAKLHDKGGWPTSSLSKAYRRRGGGTPTFDALKSLGALSLRGQRVTIGESTLRQLIRESLLAESMVTPQASLDMGIKFMINRDTDSLEVVAVQDENYVGELTASRNGLPCSGAWSVTWAQSDIDGLGPLMYDLLMDAISPDPLAADRNEVSPDAWRVWSYYLKSRPDIEAVQLDDPQDTITPEKDDNCWQVSANLWSKEEGGRWQDSPLSKAYRRKDGRTPTLNTLWRLGNLEIDG